MSDSVAEDRKRKLQEMRAKAKKGGPSTEATAAATTDESIEQKEEEDHESKEKKIKFRNYQPYDNTLKKLSVQEDLKENTVAPEDNVHIPVVPSETDIIKLELQKFNDDELNIMPKKPNWDLKVQVEGKLQKLKNRTQKAIVEILREKLAAEQNDES